MTNHQFRDQAAATGIIHEFRTRLLIVVTVLAATAGMGSPASAAPAHPASRHAPTVAKMHDETVEQRIKTLHVALKITAAQEPGWRRVAEIMRQNDAVLQAMKADPELGASVKPNAVDDLKIYEKFSQQHVNGLAKLIPAFATLYGTMPQPQQRLADNVFHEFGRGHMKLRG